jgi:hypothetical protein
MKNYADVLRGFCVATLGIGTGSSRLEENPELENAEQEGAGLHHILPFIITFTFPL